ncbi:MAG: glycosyl transferase [Acidobacteria bacterium RIFCSPLOWO2_12_FULL_67_14]|nr:MAG: glycosyl transferase [Acidobacteria bacterium RIFCSPLOWO2_12_FULL_67_14]
MIAGAASPDISVVVPVYKEEANIRPFLARLEPILEGISARYEILFCLDPSPDRTEDVIRQERARNHRIKLVVFSRRFGQPAATMAGIALSRGAACVAIDVDLQDPPEVIPSLYTKMQEGFDVVYAKRRSRKGDTRLKRLVAWTAYRVIDRLSDVRIPRDTGDFRIMSRRVCDHLNRLSEGHGFLRGLVAFVGFRQAVVEYDRDPRHAGSGKYNRFTGSARIALNGIVGFGSRPLQLLSLAGAMMAGISLLAGAWYAAMRLAGAASSPPLPAMALVVMFFSGVQLLALGLMGEYVGRIYDEVKRRPHYIIDRAAGLDDEAP